MPEGPEVETVRLGLLPIVKKTVVSVQVADHKKYRPEKDKILQLMGMKISGIRRKGKFLLFDFEKGTNLRTGLNHLGMTGVWYLYSEKVWSSFDDPFDEYKHWKVYFELDDGNHLLFVNVRTFGRFEVYSKDEIEVHPSITSLGPDILDDDFDTEEFIKRMRGKNKRARTKEVGKCLLDYNIVAGCGNIYKSEALFLAKINPFTPANELSDTQLELLGDKLSEVGKKALELKGSTLQDYKHVDGYSGLMQNEFSVYDRQGESCVDCGSEIFKGTQGDRSSFWCPSCQPL